MKSLRYIALLFTVFFHLVSWTQETPQLIAPQGHGIFPHDFDIHSNSKTIATCGLDRKIVLWDIRTGIPFLSVVAHRAEIRSIRYSWNGEYLITASPDSTVKIWNSQTLELIKSIPTKSQNLYAEFNRNTTQIVVACTNGSAKVYNLNGELVTEIKAHDDVVNCAIFSTNGNLIFTGSEDHYLRGFMIDTKKRLLDWNLEAPVYQMFFDAFNTVMVVHSTNGRAELILMPEFKSYGAVPVETTDYFGSIKYVSNIDVSPDNNYFTYADKKGQVFIADAKTKIARGFQTTHDDFISKVKYSWDMKHLVTLGHDNKMTIANLHQFDFEKSQQMPVRIVKQESDYPKKMYFDHNDNLYIRGFHTYDFNLRTGEIDHSNVHLNNMAEIKRKCQSITTPNKLKFFIDTLRNVVLVENNTTITDPSSFYFDPSRSYLVATYEDMLYTFDLKKNSFAESFRYDYEKIQPRKIIITKNKEIGILETQVLTWYHSSGKKLWDFKYKGMTDIDASLNGNKIVIGAFGKELNILDNTGKKLFKHVITDASIESVQFNHSGNQVAVTGYESTLAVINSETGSTFWKIDYPNGGLSVMCFDKKDRILAIAGADRVIHLYDLLPKKEQPIYKVFPMRDNGILVCNGDNFYTATKNAIENLAFSYKSALYTCDQFDLYYNRPDLVLSVSPYKDDAYVEMLSAAFEKRMKTIKNPATLSNNNSAVVNILNMGEFANYVTDKQITLTIEAKDSVNALQSIQIWLNGVPLYGKNGKPITGRSYQENISLDLVTGANNIKIAAINSVGMESLKSTMEVNFESAKKPNLYIACIGVSNYKDSQYNLKYAAKDASDFLATMEKSGSFEKVNKKLLTNEAVTKESLMALKTFFEQAGRDDVVMVFVAGHGVLDSDFNYYYATNDIDFNDPSKRGMAYADLENVLDNIKAIKKLLLMDTCHSGELDSEDVKEELAYNEKLEEGISFRNASTKNYSAKSSASTSLLVKELFADIRQSTGTTVISSSSGLEFSMESDQWKNGLFTYCLIQGIQSKNADFNKDGVISISELQQYIKTTVFEKSGGRQVPTFRVQNIEMDFIL
jgi:WD40 repeat protein/uncharacterized caspase-like protein